MAPEILMEVSEDSSDQQPSQAMSENKPGIMERLSMELIYHILDCGQYKGLNGTVPDRQSIRSYSLVCRSWAWYAQRLLFTNVILFSDWEVQKLEMALTQSPPQKALWLQESIKTLLIRVDRADPKVRPIRPRQANQIISLAPRLQLLELENFSYVLPGPSDLEMLQLAPPFEQLHIHNNSERTLILYDILSSLRAIKFLTLDRHKIKDLQPPYPRPWFSLYELTWLARGAIPEDLVRWILSNSKSTLQVLTFDRENPTSDFFVELLRAHGPKLRSLRMPSYAGCDVFGLRYCRRLEEFQIRTYPSKAVLQELLQRNMQTIQHLSFCATARELQPKLPSLHDPPQIPARDIEEGPGCKDPLLYIRLLVDALPNLRVVTWNFALPETDPHFPALRRQCQSKGVILRNFYVLPLGYLAGEQEEKRVATTFPRHIPLHRSRKPKYISF